MRLTDAAAVGILGGGSSLRTLYAAESYAAALRVASSNSSIRSSFLSRAPRALLLRSAPFMYPVNHVRYKCEDSYGPPSRDYVLSPRLE